MADVLLRDSDTMNMRHSLELRVPFTSHSFVDWLWKQPASYKEDIGNPKSVLADAVQDILPSGYEFTQKARVHASVPNLDEVRSA